jgi:hypothetical protein
VTIGTWFARGQRQHRDAMWHLGLSEAEQPTTPWSSVNELLGGFWPGHFWVLGGDSGNGKSTITLAMAVHWVAKGFRVLIVPLEIGGGEMRKAWAAHRLGFHPQRVFRNQLTEAERDAVKGELRWLETEGVDRVMFSDEPLLSVDALGRIYGEAQRWGAHIVVLDHLQHFDKSAGSYGTVTALCQTIVEVHKTAADHQIRTFATAQLLNRDNDPLFAYKPPTDRSIQDGDVIRQNCNAMMGIYRPLKATFAKGDAEAFRLGQKTVKDLVEPNTIGLKFIKHRVIGESKGEVVKLAFRKGKVIDPADEARSALEERYQL